MRPAYNCHTCLTEKEKGSPGLHPSNIPNQEIIEGRVLSQRPKYILKFIKLRPACLRLFFSTLSVLYGKNESGVDQEIIYRTECI